MPTQETSVKDQVAKKEMDHLLHDKVSAFRKTINERERDIFDRRIFLQRSRN